MQKIIWILLVLKLSFKVLAISDFFLKEPNNVIKERTFVDPKFAAPFSNLTVAVSRDAILTCKVHDLYQYKIAFLKVDSQTILTIQNHVITKNHRISITNTEKKIWQLKIRDVKITDRGWYMCQINTDPMKSQMSYLNVVVPPDIVDSQTSNDVIVQEFENVTLSCKATGLPEPTIVWKREQDLKSANVENRESYSFIGSVLKIPFITRHQAGIYLCIASNGIPPSVSKRLKVVVNFKPKIFAEHRTVTASIGQKVTLECSSVSFPNSVNYWMRANDDLTTKDYVLGGSYETTIDSDGTYVMKMKLNVNINGPTEFGKYKCIAKNAIGYSEETIQILPSKTTDNSHSFQPTSFVTTYFITFKNESIHNAEDDVIDKRYSIATVYLSKSSAIAFPSLIFLFLLIIIVFAI
ncbi:hypothetical protein PVAND_005889 [Polypedilum vanderplanki]|uniref:Ig-like domain-containing protein n=1 Tax=Polypedilum vanderplanki TaxID=319348 RepID=A0A9J6C1Z7_POLVA|nr:hypothetical protein PVAND_005889 [Polypedilum vanderplanki]